MPHPDFPGRRAMLAKVHIAKKDLGMPDFGYRALLRREAGVESAADADADGLRAVLARFRRLGWAPSSPAREPHGAPAQRRRIAALTRALDKPEAWAEGIARRMFERPLRLCSPEQLRGVIAAIESHRLRAAAAKGR